LRAIGGHTIVKLEEVPDILGDYPGELRLASGPLEAEQVAFSWRRMPPRTGGKGSYGHRHRTQEEIYFVVSGTLQFKLDDQVVDVGPGTVVRIAPEVARSVWNEGPDDVVLIMVSKRVDDLEADIERVPDFWPS
jgi:mannose-6-phosphate isomerase-like protein (cupin superfamily)